MPSTGIEPLVLLSRAQCSNEMSYVAAKLLLLESRCSLTELFDLICREKANHLDLHIKLRAQSFIVQISGRLKNKQNMSIQSKLCSLQIFLNLFHFNSVLKQSIMTIELTVFQKKNNLISFISKMF